VDCWDLPQPSRARYGSDIYCSSFSKCLAPGYRVGWIAAGAYAQQVMEGKLAFSLCGPALLQVALADFLASGAYDAHLLRVRRISALRPATFFLRADDSVIACA